MPSFAHSAKLLRIKLQMIIAEELTLDYATRFAFSEAINNRMMQSLNELNRKSSDRVFNDPDCKHAYKYNQAIAINQVFGDGEPVIKKHLYEAVEFISTLNQDQLRELEVGITYKLREVWLPPVIHGFSIIIPSSGINDHFEDTGEVYAAE